MSPKTINALLITGAIASVALIAIDYRQKKEFSTPVLSTVGKIIVIGGGVASLFYLKKRLV